MRRLLLPILAVLGLASPALAQLPDSRCAAIEAPRASGAPHVFLPSGAGVPYIGPLEAADVARGARRDAVVTCVELLPGPPHEPGSQVLRTWAVHVEAPFSTIVRGADGVCRAPHHLVYVADRPDAPIVSRRGLDGHCAMEPLRLLRGR